MSDDTDTTTVEVKTDTWLALDRRKDRGDSFDDVIRRLIDNSAVGFGKLQEVYQPLDYGDIESVPENETPDAGCSHYDVVSGGQCDNDVTHQQEWKHPGEDDWSLFYYCDDHVPNE